MFFHTHVYYSKKVDENLDSLKVIGSMLPDFALTSVITWDNLHKKKDILDFSSYIEKSEPDFVSLLKGINYHNTVDYLTHVKYKNTIGYAYNSITPKLISLVSKVFLVDEKRARISSHNCIESGVEFYLLNDNPDLAQLVKDSIKEINKQKLAKVLATFYKKSEKEMLDNLNILFSFATNYDLKDIDGWVMLWSDLNKFYLKKEANKDLVKEAIQLSLEITKNTYKEFIETAISSKNTEIKDCN